VDSFVAGYFFGGFTLAAIASLAWWLINDGFEDGTIEH